MLNSNEKDVDPKKVAKIINLTIAILTAILGFFTGTAAHAATTYFFH